MNNIWGRRILSRNNNNNFNERESNEKKTGLQLESKSSHLPPPLPQRPEIDPNFESWITPYKSNRIDDELGSNDYSENLTDLKIYQFPYEPILELTAGIILDLIVNDKSDSVVFVGLKSSSPHYFNLLISYRMKTR